MNLFDMEKNPKVCLEDFIAPKETKERISELLKAYRQRRAVQKYGLDVSKKILVIGPPGTGKSFLASVLASELHLPLKRAKWLGRTEDELERIFDEISNKLAVYVFDLGIIDTGAAVPESIKLGLNRIFQFLETGGRESLILMLGRSQSRSTPENFLTPKTFWRFDEVFRLQEPGDEERSEILTTKLKAFDKSFTVTPELIQKTKGLSHADLILCCEKVIKDALLKEKKTLDPDLFIKFLKER